MCCFVLRYLKRKLITPKEYDKLCKHLEKGYKKRYNEYQDRDEEIPFGRQEFAQNEIPKFYKGRERKLLDVKNEAEEQPSAIEFTSKTFDIVAGAFAIDLLNDSFSSNGANNPWWINVLVVILGVLVIVLLAFSLYAILDNSKKSTWKRPVLRALEAIDAEKNTTKNGKNRNNHKK